MTVLSLDFETFSEVDIKKCGAHYYARHPSTEALMLAWATDNEPVEIWDIASGKDMPRGLRDLLSLPNVTVSAFNATFERLILEHVLGVKIPVERFRCTMARAYSLAFTGGLDDVLDQFNQGVHKDSKGKKLINRFSKPQPKNQKVRRWTHENDPEGWGEFKEYCKKDVEVERTLSRNLSTYEWQESEQELYNLDQKINDRGVPVDLDLVDAALQINEIEREKLVEELRSITGLSNPNSNAQLEKWLAEHGLELPNMQAETIEQAVSEEDPNSMRYAALELKQQLAKTSVTKWKAFDRCTGPDGRACGMFQFGGASRTNRWAGRLVQLQNLARGGNTTKDPETLADIMVSGGHEVVNALYGSSMMALSDTLRAAITAPEGYHLNVSDLSSVESRVLGWVSDCKKINLTFANGLDTYKVFAADFYHIAYDSVTKEQRTFCKPPVLGGGFGLGGAGMVKYAESMGVKMSEDEAQATVDAFREMYPEVVDFWAWCKDAVFYTTRTGKPYNGAHGLKTFARGEFVFMQLPSGRRIAYYQPKIELRKAPWGAMVENFTFMGKDRFTMKWQRISAHPGFLCENIVQAIARDILKEWMLRANAAEFEIVGHVHDELICVERVDRVEELNAIIRGSIEWADGLILDADGYVAKRYRKD